MFTDMNASLNVLSVIYNICSVVFRALRISQEAILIFIFLQAFISGVFSFNSTYSVPHRSNGLMLGLKNRKVGFESS